MNLFGRRPEITPQSSGSPTKKESNDCEIEIKNTSQGKKIKFKGNCKKEQIEAFANRNGVSIDD